MRFKEGSDEKIVYEKKLNKMLDCWYLSSHNRLLFMEDLGSRKITFVNLPRAEIYGMGDTTSTKTFILPGDVKLAKRLSHNLEGIVRRHGCPDKQLVRDYIRR